MEKYLASKSAATLTKGTKQSLINAKATVDGNKFYTGANAVGDYSASMIAGAIKSIIYGNVDDENN